MKVTILYATNAKPFLFRLNYTVH
uniref:Uncharacterized protein n=1 Tax=Anguilla anguilla TaxID=7936 RepID=A0A0E9PYW8_ANGAN